MTERNDGGAAMTDAARAEYWQGVAKRSLAKQHDMAREHAETAKALAGLEAENGRLREALSFAKPALVALEAYEADCGAPLDDLHEIGRIDDSRGSPSFRIRVGHIRRLAAARSLSPKDQQS